MVSYIFLNDTLQLADTLPMISPKEILYVLDTANMQVNINSAQESVSSKITQWGQGIGGIATALTFIYLISLTMIVRSCDWLTPIIWIKRKDPKKRMNIDFFKIVVLLDSFVDKNNWFPVIIGCLKFNYF